MRRHRSSPRNLFYRVDVTPFLTIMTALLIIVMVDPGPSRGRGAAVDLPKVTQPIPIQGALRNDAIIVTVKRDDVVYLGSDQLMPGQLSAAIQADIRNGSEKKVYIQADARARYASVESVLDGIRLAGVQNIAFIVNQKAKTPGW